MTIEVNTKSVDWVEGESVQRLLKRMNYKFPLVVVKIDGQVVKRDGYASTAISDGSRVEVIHLISGG